MHHFSKHLNFVVEIKTTCKHYISCVRKKANLWKRRLLKLSHVYLEGLLELKEAIEALNSLASNWWFSAVEMIVRL